MIDIATLLGDEAEGLLTHKCTTIPYTDLHLPGYDYVDRVVAHKNRKPAVLRNLNSIINHGRLAGSGYVSILPVDQGVEHTAGASFAPNPMYFDPDNIVKLAVEGGCNAVASTLGVLGAVQHTPEQLEIDLKWIDDHVEGKPYGIDLLIPNKMAHKGESQLTTSDLEAEIPAERLGEVFKQLRALRFMDENIYLRSGSFNTFNGIVGLNFSCDGTHYLPVPQFLEKGYSFWFGG